MLEKHSLKYCPINELNDPFEFMPGGYDMHRKALRKHVELLFEQRKSYYLTEIRKQHPDMSERCLNELFNANCSSLFNSLYEDLQNRNWENFIDEASKRYGVLSLCEDPTNILMWSHYADSHKGIVIGIDSCVLNNPKKVHYTSNRPFLKPSFDSSEKEFKDAVVKLMTTKATEWNYEKEWRCIEELDKLTHDHVFKKKTLYLDLSLSLDNIKEIYFGTKMLKEDKERIMQIFSGINPIFFNLQYNHTRYSFDIKTCEILS